MQDPNPQTIFDGQPPQTHVPLVIEVLDPQFGSKTDTPVEVYVD